MTAVEDEVLAACGRGRAAAAAVAQMPGDARDACLRAMASKLRAHMEGILQANSQDVALAESAGTSPALVDRLALDGARVESMAAALEALVDLPDPVGRVLEQRTLYNGLDLKRISVPLGLVAVVYEARPNVTADAAGICIKAGNACILRGGSMAARSNAAIADALRAGASAAGAPADAIIYLPQKTREATRALMRARGLVDVLVPRGGAGLIRTCVEESWVPVIETGTGNCHVYVHASADMDMAVRVVENAKCRRYGVCNAAESLLVDAAAAREFLPRIAGVLAAHGVVMHADPATLTILREGGGEGEGEGEGLKTISPPEATGECSVAQTVLAGKILKGQRHYPSKFTRCGTRFVSTPPSPSATRSGFGMRQCKCAERLCDYVVPATGDDWGREYLAPEISVRVVGGVEEAVRLIDKYSTHHSDAIVARDEAAIDAFVRGVDSAAVYVNASTAFTDGGEFGLGAEIGISTQKLHARGPFATEALTTYKYVITGNGQVRE